MHYSTPLGSGVLGDCFPRVSVTGAPFARGCYCLSPSGLFMSPAARALGERALFISTPLRARLQHGVCCADFLAAPFDFPFDLAQGLRFGVLFGFWGNFLHSAVILL